MFQVVIFSGRSGQDGGIRAMRTWLGYWAERELPNDEPGYTRNAVINYFRHDKRWPTSKPAAFVTLDDRAVTFRGTWPDLDELQRFRPWNKSVVVYTSQPPSAGLAVSPDPLGR